MSWAHVIRGVSPEERARADDIAMRKHELAEEAARIRDEIIQRMNELLDEEVTLYKSVACRLKLPDDVMYGPAIQAMDYQTMMRLLQSRQGGQSTPPEQAKRSA